MQKTSRYLLLCIVLFILGYGLAWVPIPALQAWYLESGNAYFHFAGGLAIALLVTSYYSTEFGKLSQPFRFFCIVAIAMGIGVLWEFHEYILTQLAHRSFQGDLDDTMHDLLLDTLGGVVAGLFTPRLFRER